MRCLMVSVIVAAACTKPAPAPVAPAPAPVVDHGPAAQPSSSPVDPVADGRKLYEHKGCVSCHTLDGSPRVGPSWLGIWDTDVKTTDGRVIHVDAAYVRKSMMTPLADVVANYPESMPSFEGQLSDSQIASLTALIASLKR